MNASNLPGFNLKMILVICLLIFGNCVNGSDYTKSQEIKTKGLVYDGKSGLCVDDGDYFYDPESEEDNKEIETQKFEEQDLLDKMKELEYKGEEILTRIPAPGFELVLKFSYIMDFLKFRTLSKTLKLKYEGMCNDEIEYENTMGNTEKHSLPKFIERILKVVDGRYIFYENKRLSFEKILKSIVSCDNELSRKHEFVPFSLKDYVTSFAENSFTSEDPEIAMFDEEQKQKFKNRLLKFAENFATGTIYAHKSNQDAYFLIFNNAVLLYPVPNIIAPAIFFAAENICFFDYQFNNNFLGLYFKNERVIVNIMGDNIDTQKILSEKDTKITEQILNGVLEFEIFDDLEDYTESELIRDEHPYLEWINETQDFILIQKVPERDEIYKNI